MRKPLSLVSPLVAVLLASPFLAACTENADSADGDGGVVGIIRSEKAKVTTIDSVGQIAASVSTPLALASTRAGTTGHYGFDKGAEAVMPPVTK